jgi:hypothetical protein
MKVDILSDSRKKKNYFISGPQIDYARLDGNPFKRASKENLLIQKYGS